MDAGQGPEWSLSIVSHGHARSVERLLGDCARVLDPARHEIIVTRNLNGARPISACGWQGRLSIIGNVRRHGFAENHNAALGLARGRYIATIDPDLRIESDPFPLLRAVLDAGPLRLAAPIVVDDAGRVQDNARRLLTPFALLRRYVMKRDDSCAVDGEPRRCEWVAGLFIAARRETLTELRGFDPRFHLYCEDTDLSLRCWNRGGEVWAVPSRAVVHVARRQTLKSGRHFLWHLASMLKLWTSWTFWKYLVGRRGRA